MAEQNVNLILKQEEKHEEEEVVISFSTIFRKLKRYFAVWLMVSVLVGGLIGGGKEKMEDSDVMSSFEIHECSVSGSIVGGGENIDAVVGIPAARSPWTVRAI